MKKYIIIFFSIILFTKSFSQLQDKRIINIAIEKSKSYIVSNKNFITIIDFNKSINEERLYVVDMRKNKIILKSTVSHAFNSGRFNTGFLYADNFSNTLNSNKSSIGAYITKGTYYGKFGYSLILKGLDKTNSNAEKRKIIFHSNKLMKTKWSWGCFATPDQININLINIIKNGTLVYAFK